MPEGSVVEIRDPDTGALEESFRVFVGSDNIGYVIDKKDPVYLPTQLTKRIKEPLIYATSEDSLNPATLRRNYFWTTYMGHRNPKTYGDNDSFHYLPTSLIEWAAYNHDIWYLIVGADGIGDAFLNGFTLEADKQLVRALRYELGQLVSGKNLSTRESIRDCVSAVGVIIFFGNISDFKAIKLPYVDQPLRDIRKTLFEKDYNKMGSRYEIGKK